MRIVLLNNIVKPAGFAVAGGYLVDFLPNLTESFCRLNPNNLKNLLCMRSAVFFNPANLEKVFYPITQLRNWITIGFGSVLPRFKIVSSNLSQVLDLINQAYQNPRLKAQLDASDIIPYLTTCQPRYTNTMIALCFAEEVVFRQLIQKTLMLSLAKLMPERYGKVLSHPSTRIALTSLLFAFCHTAADKNYFVLPHFTAGLIYGAIFEKYGVLASSTSHLTTELIVTYREKNACEISNPGVIKMLSGLLKLK